MHFSPDIGLLIFSGCDRPLSSHSIVPSVGITYFITLPVFFCQFVPKVTITSDLVPTLNESVMEQAQQLLRQVETECKKVGLELNVKRTDVMAINIPAHDPSTTIKGKELARKLGKRWHGKH